MPPGRAVDSPGFFGWLQIARTGLISLVWDIGLSRFYRILVAFPSIPEGAKHATFAPGELYYYVVMIATDEKFRGKGLCAKVLERVKDQAQRDGKPVWLEATTRGSRKVYQKVGFEDVFTDETEEGGGLLIGKGVCDEEGDERSGKEKVGFVIWPMVWWPQGYVKGVGMQS
jgi:GNAT superfamily N-acetyltransferase